MKKCPDSLSHQHPCKVSPDPLAEPGQETHFYSKYKHSHNEAPVSQWNPHIKLTIEECVFSLTNTSFST